MTQAGDKGNIMAVDDNPANLKLLEGMLRGQGYGAAATENPPELILLDIHMQEMTGYQVCERLKAIDKLARIPSY